MRQHHVRRLQYIRHIVNQGGMRAFAWMFAALAVALAPVSARAQTLNAASLNATSLNTTSMNEKAAHMAAASGDVNWTTKLDADHPLVGRIYAIKGAANKKLAQPTRELGIDELIDRLSGERFLLLGEIHDNPDHHKLQAFIISELVRRGRRPAIVMEQINADQRVLLQLFMSGKYKTAARLGPAVNWAGSGWPAWENYQPIAQSALEAGLSIVAGDTSKNMNRKVGKQGFDALPAGEVEALGLQHPLGPKLDKALLSELVSSHCNMMPASSMGPMKRVQRYRDAHLARAMRQAGEEADKNVDKNAGGAVLIAGNGHVRTDRAVPWYLRGDNTPSVTLMIVEAHKSAKTPLDLLPMTSDGKPTADFVWITPRAEREDPCESLRKRFKGKMHGKHGK